MDQILCIIHFCQNQNNHEMFTATAKLCTSWKKMTLSLNSYLWVWKFWKFIFTKNDFISFLLRNFHWIMWPFYTNFSHKTNNRKGNIILSFKTLGIKLCLGRSSFAIIKRFKELSNDNVRIVRVPWLQGWKFETADFIKKSSLENICDIKSQFFVPMSCGVLIFTLEK